MKYLFLLLFFVGCKSASQLTYKAIEKDRAKVAEITRKEWPCVTVKADTVYKTDSLYDLIEIQCPDSTVYIIDSFETITAIRVPVKIKVPQLTITKTILVETTIRDKADSTIFQDQVDKLNKKLIKKGKTVVAFASIAGVLLLLLLIVIFLLIKKTKVI